MELRSFVCMSIQQNFGAYAITSQIISIFWWFWWKCFHWFYYRENPQIVSSCWFQTWCFRGLKIAVFKMWKEGGPILRKCAFFGGLHLFSEAIFPSNLARRLFPRGFSQGVWKVLADPVNRQAASRRHRFVVVQSKLCQLKILPGNSKRSCRRFSCSSSCLGWWFLIYYPYAPCMV